MGLELDMTQQERTRFGEVLDRTAREVRESTPEENAAREELIRRSLAATAEQLDDTQSA